MKNVIIVLVIAAVLWSCQNDDNETPVQAEFLIAAKVSNDIAEYEQTVFDGGSNGAVNVFNRSDKTLFLQSFKDGKDDGDGFWTIRIQGVDIENVTLPYTLTGVEGSVTWVDQSIKKMQAPCANPDVLCFYSGVGVDEVKITINEISDNNIIGKFEGKLYHIRVNPTVDRDPNDISEVVDGSFKIKFQTK